MSFLSSLFGSKPSSDQIKVLSPADFKQAIQSIDKKKQLIDVRTASEFQGGHIKGAVNIDFFNSAKFVESLQKYDKDKAIYLYCRSGNRSGNAARKLENLGFKEIYDLRGGYMSWH
ncbi:rhodanese-like domain-containing protein [Nonlabens mediterrranea]|uniref:Rhodanese-like domain-containing protein n=1 Tax=Nonlabens mediterrranea TaxID=1419947 RepID=A0ABS0A677_9FLAO|nr:rhodanese-like domain-containing protein [Nonlabens mediterrranea]